MAEGNVDILRRGYDAFNRGDIDTVMGLLDPNIEWQEPEVEGLPQRGTHRGAEDVANRVFGAIVENWDGFQAVPEEFLEAGDRVVVLGQFEGAGKTSGRTLDATFAHVWTMRDGRAVQFRSYADTANFLHSLG